MKSKIIFALFALLSSFLLHAQGKKISFRSTLQAGMLEGQAGTSFQLQSINGIQYGLWSTGIGVGLDYYHTRSIPVFLDIRRSILNRSQSPFIYASGGYHFPWVKNQGETIWWGGATERKGGLYYDAGIGYQFQVLKRNSLFFSAGYSYKQFSEEIAQYTYCLVAPCPEYKQTFDYQVRRVSIKTGLRF